MNLVSGVDVNPKSNDGIAAKDPYYANTNGQRQQAAISTTLEMTEGTGAHSGYADGDEAFTALPGANRVNVTYTMIYFYPVITASDNITRTNEI